MKWQKRFFGGRGLDISRLVYDPNKKTFFLSVTLENKPGTLSMFSRCLSELNLNILGILSESIVTKEEIEISMFVEVIDRKVITAKELEDIINEKLEEEKVKVVRSLKVFDHLVGGIDADVYHFPILVANERAVIFTMDTLEALVKNIRKVLQECAIEAILFYQGREIGRSIKKYYEEQFKVAEASEILELFGIRFITLGWGILEVSELDVKRKNAKLRIYDNWECTLFKGRNEPQSHLIRGILTGLFESLFGTEVDVKETSCIAKGDKFCEFIVE